MLAVFPLSKMMCEMVGWAEYALEGMMQHCESGEWPARIVFKNYLQNCIISELTLKLNCR